MHEYAMFGMFRTGVIMLYLLFSSILNWQCYIAHACILNMQTTITNLNMVFSETLNGAISRGIPGRVYSYYINRAFFAL